MNQKEPDDYLHNPDPRRDRKNDAGGTIFTARGLMNLGCLFFLAAGLITLLCVHFWAPAARIETDATYPTHHSALATL